MLHGQFPEELKNTLIFPVFKKGDPKKILNYRPIAILSSIEKVLERTVYDAVYKHVRPQLSDIQHGFLKGKSTVTNLLDHSHDIIQAFNRNSQMDVLYTDMSKAFDKVNHILLLNKLQKFGIKDQLLNWFNTYLMNRPLEVVFNGEVSDVFIATSGVPQGSILGPLLFLLYIDDISSNIASSTSLYADDMKLSYCIEDTQSGNQLQNDIASIQNWCNENSLPLNETKCVIASFTTKKNTDYVFVSYERNEHA